MSTIVRSTSPRLVRVSAMLTLILVSITVSAAVPVQADVNITVAPSLLDVVADAGASTTQDISISNDGDTAVSLAIEVVEPMSVPEDRRAGDWVRIDASALDIPAGDVGVLGVELDIPEDATSGGHYVNIRMTTVGAVDDAGSSLSGEVIVPVFFTIDGEGDIERSVSVGHFAAFLEADGRIGFRAEITNSGNVHYRAPGTVDVLDATGGVLTTLELTETTFILPGQSRNLQAHGTLPLQPGAEYRGRATIDIGASDPIEAETSFTLETLEAAPLAMAICENLDGGPTVTFGMSNPGQLGVLPAVELVIRDATQGVVLDTSLPSGTLLWPNDTTQVQAQLPERLLTGAYTLTGSIQVGASEPVQSELAFEIGGASPQTAPICQ